MTGNLVLVREPQICVCLKICGHRFGTFLRKILCPYSMPNCPECTAREKKRVQERYEAETPLEDRNRDALFRLFDSIELFMKYDAKTKHFVCPKCGLYATREQVGDIRARLNRREYTKEDKQYDYQQWWQKSKDEKRR